MMDVYENVTINKLWEDYSTFGRFEYNNPLEFFLVRINASILDRTYAEFDYNSIQCEDGVFDINKATESGRGFWIVMSEFYNDELMKYKCRLILAD